MGAPLYFTYDDAIQHVLDFAGAAADEQTERFARKAVQLALNTVQGRNWNCYVTQARITTVAPYSTGTVVFDYSGGVCERALTLTDGEWPAWAGDGTVVIGTVAYAVASRISTTVLPVDFGAMGALAGTGSSRHFPQRVRHDQLVEVKSRRVASGFPQLCAICEDTHRFGSLAMLFSPFPDQAYNLDYAYRRRARRLAIDQYATGTVSITDGSRTLSGSGTNWNSHFVDCIVRFPMDSSGEVPTGLGGANPFFLERTIVGFTDSATMTLDQDPQLTLTNVKYSISDPLDIEAGSMLTYFLREAEMQMRLIRRQKPTTDENSAYILARTQAFEADSRHYEERSSYDGVWNPWTITIPRQ